MFMPFYVLCLTCGVGLERIAQRVSIPKIIVTAAIDATDHCQGSIIYSSSFIDLLSPMPKNINNE